MTYTYTHQKDKIIIIHRHAQNTRRVDINYQVPCDSHRKIATFRGSTRLVQFSLKLQNSNTFYEHLQKCAIPKVMSREQQKIFYIYVPYYFEIQFIINIGHHVKTHYCVLCCLIYLG